MSNNAFLFATRAPEVCESPTETEHLLWTGPNMLPVLWAGAFRLSDLVTVVRDGAEATQLFAPKLVALSACRAFQAGLRSSPRVRGLGSFLTTFENSVANLPGEGLQLDDYELQCMIGTAENKAWLTNCLAFVEDVAQSRVSGDAIFDSEGARELFDQAQVDLKDWSTHIGWQASLLGHGQP